MQNRWVRFAFYVNFTKTDEQTNMTLSCDDDDDDDDDNIDEYGRIRERLLRVFVY